MAIVLWFYRAIRVLDQYQVEFSDIQSKMGTNISQEAGQNKGKFTLPLVLYTKWKEILFGLIWSHQGQVSSIF